MPTSDTALAPDALVGLAFPVIRVRYAGPTDHRGSRYIATLRGVRHTEHYDYAMEDSRNPYNAAAACWAKYRAAHAEAFQSDTQERVFIPGDLDADSYSYTVVPVRFFTPGHEAETYAEQVTAAQESDDDTAAARVTVTRTDYPGAPLPGDRFGWVIVGAIGGHMTEPYRDKSHAVAVRDTFAPEASVQHVALDWS